MSESTYPSAAREIARILRDARAPLASANLRLEKLLAALRERCDEPLPATVRCPVFAVKAA